MHDFLPKGASEDQTCIDLRNHVIVFGKVSEKNTLIKRTETIGEFYVRFYMPLLYKYKYRYHGGLVKIFSKHRGYELWQTAFLAYPHYVMTRRDYTEHLVAPFNEEINSTHFGQGITVSIEGCFLEFKTSRGTVKAHFHRHMSEISKQNTPCTSNCIS